MNGEEFVKLCYKEKETIEKEKLMKFRIKKEFTDLAYYLIKKAHPYEVPVINIF